VNCANDWGVFAACAPPTSHSRHLGIRINVDMRVSLSRRGASREFCVKQRAIDPFLLDKFEWRRFSTFGLAFFDMRVSLSGRGTSREFWLNVLPAPHPVGGGIDFLGDVLRRSYRLPPQARDGLHATLASYLGHFKHAAHQQLVAALRRRYRWLDQWFAWAADGTLLQATWSAAAPHCLADEWQHFRARFPGRVVLLRVGTEYLAADDAADRLVAMRLMQPVLPPRSGLRSTARVARRALPRPSASSGPALRTWW